MSKSLELVRIEQEPVHGFGIAHFHFTRREPARIDILPFYENIGIASLRARMSPPAPVRCPLRSDKLVLHVDDQQGGVAAFDFE